MPELTAPDRIAGWLEENGYNGRAGAARVREYSKYILSDILRINPTLQTMAENGNLSFALQTGFPAGASTVNLAIGPIESDVEHNSGDLNEFEIALANPDEIWFALRLRNLMTQVGRNLNNRMNEMVSMALEAQYNEGNVVVAGLIVTSTADPVHYIHQDNENSRPNVDQNMETAIRDLPNILKTAGEESSKLDAVSILMTDHDGISDGTNVVTDSPPAPDEESTINYDNFIRRISDEIDHQFLGLPDPHTAEAEELIDRHESNVLDFKHSLTGELEREKKDVIAFLNTRGGILIVGIDDGEDERDDRLVGVDDIEEAQGRLSGSLRKAIRPWPVDKIHFDPIRVDDYDLLLVRVAESTERLYAKEGRFLTRIGEANISMQFEDLEAFLMDKIIQEHHLDDLVS